MIRTGVLVHGYDLCAPNWHKVVWGTPPHFPGRLPKAIHVLHQFGAEVMIFGTGAAEKNGRKEGVFTLEYLKDHGGDLREFNLLSELGDIELEELRVRLQRVAQPETNSQNTAEEIQIGFQVLSHPMHGWQRIQQVVLVSSADHISRCLRDALAAIENRFPRASFANGVVAVPARTCYTAAQDPGQVQVIEPGLCH